MSAALGATVAFCWLFWPWLAAGVIMTLVVSLVDRDAQVGVPDALRPARGCVLGVLVSLALLLVLAEPFWIAFRPG